MCEVLRWAERNAKMQMSGAEDLTSVKAHGGAVPSGMRSELPAGGRCRGFQTMPEDNKKFSVVP